jgi:hypothetical protein
MMPVTLLDRELDSTRKQRDKETQRVKLETLLSINEEVPDGRDAIQLGTVYGIKAVYENASRTDSDWAEPRRP